MENVRTDMHYGTGHDWHIGLRFHSRRSRCKNVCFLVLSKTEYILLVLGFVFRMGQIGYAKENEKFNAPIRYQPTTFNVSKALNATLIQDRDGFSGWAPKSDWQNRTAYTAPFTQQPTAVFPTQLLSKR